MKLSKTFVDDIRELVLSARATVSRGVDIVQVHTNFTIGRRIVEQEQAGRSRANYGEAVIKELAERLTAEFGKGFSKRNLDYMRRFYLEYVSRQIQIVQPSVAQLGAPPQDWSVPSQFPIVQSLIAQSGADNGQQTRPFTLSWTHYLFLLGVKSADERSFYEIEATAQNWTVRELKRQFNSSLYERLALSRDKDGIRKLAKEGQLVAQPQDILKEPLVLEFLGLDERRRNCNKNSSSGPASKPD